MVRDKKGRFQKGAAPGPGRPPKATEAEYLDALKEIVPLERFKKMVEAQALRAERGNIISFNALIGRLVPERRDLSIEHSGSLNILGLEEMLDRVYGDGSGDTATKP